MSKGEIKTALDDTISAAHSTESDFSKLAKDFLAKNFPGIKFVNLNKGLGFPDISPAEAENRFFK